MNNLHKITTSKWTDVQKAYQLYWGEEVRFKKTDPNFFSHHTSGGWFDESFGELTWDYLLGNWVERGSPEPDLY